MSFLLNLMRLPCLPDRATLEDYNQIIASVVNSNNANIYLYKYTNNDTDIYPTVTATISAQIWLVMIGMDGVLETAFPPDSPENYLGQSNFVFLGSKQELYT
ncbi:MAG TPA: hypothetical protein IGS52_10460 [Oscillatoriaceae cyanobacterium M33_DOE_052]|uniref:Uncharacterized protein n=1 Tax=Planktothricoides sp. SpSt-374 TaxID=2282167 RepID=A0A7C3ZP16_9CYAN|nr:hypothetical protein [Oscillatoriaceae cyanobacterium M33_DOE_052]